MQRKGRRWFRDLRPVCVVCIAGLWVWFGGDETARFVRGVFAVLDPEAILEVGAGFAVMGLLDCTPRFDAGQPVDGLAVALQRP